MAAEPSFNQQVYGVVKLVPAGKVTTYGAIARELGHPRGARQVGWALAALTDQESVLKLARDVENIAAQTYVEAAGVFTTGELRQAGMSIGETEAKHIAVLNMALGYRPVPLPALPTGKAIDEKGYIS